MGSRATGPELGWSQADGEAHSSDSLPARLKRLGSSRDNSRHAHNRVASQQYICLDTQVLAGLVHDREAAALAAGSSRAGDPGRQEEALEQRLRRLGG